MACGPLRRLPGSENSTQAFMHGSAENNLKEWKLQRSAVKVLRSHPISFIKDGDVFKGRLGNHPLLSKKVAVKVVNISGVPIQRVNEALAEICWACRAARDVKPGVVPLRGFVHVRGVELLIVMDRSKEDLNAWMARKGGQLHMTDVIPMAFQASQALSELHAKRIVHGNISPSTIHLSRFRVAELADIGMSHIHRDILKLPDPDPTRDAHYGSPEEADPTRIVPLTAKSDVWRLAATILHAATGREPYHGLSVMQVLGSHARRIPPTVPEELVPAEVVQLLRRCFNFEPTMRPSAKALANVFSDINKPSTWVPACAEGKRRRIEQDAKVTVDVQTLTSKRLRFCLKRSATIADLKAFIQDAEGLPVDLQRIIIGGREAEDGTMLDDKTLPDGGVVHLVSSLRGC